MDQLITIFVQALTSPKILVFTLAVATLSVVALRVTGHLREPMERYSGPGLVAFLVVLFLVTSMFNRITIGLGINIQLFELVGLILLLMVLVNLIATNPSKILNIALPPHLLWVFAFFAYALVSLLLGATLAPEYNLVNPTINNDPLFRPLIQGGSLVVTFVASILVYRLARGREESSGHLLSAVYLSVGLLLMVAFIQLFLTRSGYPEWFVVPTSSPGEERLITDDFSGLVRLSSWAGEPRTFANTLLLLLPVLLYARNPAIRRLVPMRPVFLLWGAVAFLFTFSASAVVALGLIFALHLLFAAKRHVILGIGILAFGAVLALWSLDLTLGEVPIFNRTVVSIQRVFSGSYEVAKPVSLLGTDIYMDFNEQPVLGMLLDNPTHLLFGVGWGNITFYVRPYLDEFLGPGASTRIQSVIRPNMTLLRFLGDVGIVGTGILAWGIVSLLARARRLGRVMPAEGQFATSFILTLVASFVVFTGSHDSIVLLLLIAAYIDSRLMRASHEAERQMQQPAAARGQT